MQATQTSTTAPDEREIRRLYDGLLAAWTRGDAEAYGAGFTADVDYVPFDGSRLTGRQAVVDSHDRLFHGVLSGSALVGEVETVPPRPPRRHRRARPRVSAHAMAFQAAQAAPVTPDPGGAANP